MCAKVCKGVRGCVWVCEGVRGCVWVGEGVCGCARVCVGVRCACFSSIAIAEGGALGVRSTT